VQVAHEIAFTIPRDAIAQDQVLHASADVDRVDLDPRQVVQRRSDGWARSVEQDGATMEPAGVGAGKGKRR
jgi:hypothetical protein